jgi:hypothetical protein
MSTISLNGIEFDNWYNDFMESIVTGKGYQGIADLVANTLNVGVLIEDKYFKVLARSHLDDNIYLNIRKQGNKKYLKPQRIDPKVANYVALAKKSSGNPIKMPEMPEYGVALPRQVFPVLVKEEIKGYLHVFIKELDKEQLRFIRAALISLIFLITLQHARLELKDEMRRTLILGLISDKSKFDVIQWEKGILGLDLAREMAVAAIKILAAPGRQQLEDVLFSITKDMDMNTNLVAINDDQAVILIQSAEGTQLEMSMVNKSLQVVFEILKTIFKDSKVRIGVGRMCFDPRDYKVAYAEACKVLNIMEANPRMDEGIMHHNSLRLMGILPLPGGDNTLAKFVKDVIGKLYEYSMEHNVDLIETPDSCTLSYSVRS